VPGKVTIGLGNTSQTKWYTHLWDQCQEGDEHAAYAVMREYGTNYLYTYAHNLTKTECAINT